MVNVLEGEREHSMPDKARTERENFSVPAMSFFVPVTHTLRSL